MKTCAVACLTLAVTLLSPGSATAQDCPSLEPGTPVRFVHAREVAWRDTEGNVVRRESLETPYRDAVLVSLDSDSLRTRVESAPLAVPVSEVRSFRIPCPTTQGRSALRGFRTGFLVGGAAGLLLGAAVGSDSFFSDSTSGHVGFALLGAGVLGLGGGLLGAVIGASSGPGTAWTAVPLVAPPAAAGGGDWTVGLRISLGG